MGTDHQPKTRKNQDVTPKGEGSRKITNRKTKMRSKRTQTTTQQQMNNNRRKHKSKTKRENIEETNNSKTPNQNPQKMKKQYWKTKKMRRTRNATI
jgi:hypothetical protein